MMGGPIFLALSPFQLVAETRAIKTTTTKSALTAAIITA